jgi:hypothetical protein
MTKLKNQSELTQITYFGGENGGGLVELARIASPDMLGSARSGKIAEVSCEFALKSWIDTATNAATAAENKPV